MSISCSYESKNNNFNFKEIVPETVKFFFGRSLIEINKRKCTLHSNPKLPKSFGISIVYCFIIMDKWDCKTGLINKAYFFGKTDIMFTPILFYHLLFLKLRIGNNLILNKLL